MNKVVKVVVGLVVVLAVVLVVGIVVAGIYINDIAKQGVERGSTYALGVATTVNSVSVGLFGGTFGMDAYQAAQPEGFGDSSLLEMGNAEVAVTATSLMEDVVEIPYLRLHDITINLVKNENGANHEVILEHLQSLSSGETTEPATDEPAKKFIIREIDLQNITVSLQGYPVVENAGPLTIKGIQLKDVGTGNENGIDMAHLTGVIMREIFAAVANNLGDVLPGVLLGSLEDGLQGLGGLGDVGTKVVGDIAGEAGKVVEGVAGEAGKAVEGVGEEAGKAVEGAADEAGKAVDDAAKQLGEGLGGLLGGDKKKKEAE